MQFIDLITKTLPIETHSTDFRGNKKAVRTDCLVCSVTFPEKSINSFFPQVLLLLFAGATPSLLLLSLPPTVLPTHSVCAFGSHSAVPFVCWRLVLSTGAFTSVSCRASASRHTSASRFSPSVGCCISQSLSCSSCLRPAPWPPPFITPSPFIAPLLFGWLLHCPAPQPPSCCNSAWCLGLRLLLQPRL
jgi:hypothetical protein